MSDGHARLPAGGWPQLRTVVHAFPAWSAVLRLLEAKCKMTVPIVENKKTNPGSSASRCAVVT